MREAQGKRSRRIPTSSYWESYDDVHKAIGREKQLKGWRRAKKVAPIESVNPHWLDLAKDWYPWMKESGAGRDAVLRGAQDLGTRLERRATAPTSTPPIRWQATGQPPLSMTKQGEK